MPDQSEVLWGFTFRFFDLSFADLVVFRFRACSGLSTDKPGGNHDIRVDRGSGSHQHNLLHRTLPSHLCARKDHCCVLTMTVSLHQLMVCVPHRLTQVKTRQFPTERKDWTVAAASLFSDDPNMHSL